MKNVLGSSGCSGRSLVVAGSRYFFKQLLKTSENFTIFTDINIVFCLITESFVIEKHGTKMYLSKRFLRQRRD